MDYDRQLKRVWEQYKPEASYQFDEPYPKFDAKRLFLPGAYSTAEMYWRSKEPLEVVRPKAMPTQMLLPGAYTKERMLWSQREPAWKRGWTHYKEPTRVAEEQVPKKIEDTVVRYVEPGVYEKEPVVGPELGSTETRKGGIA